MAVGDIPEPRVIPALKQAWTNIWPHFWWLLLFGFLTSLATGTSGGENVEVNGASLFLNIGGSLLAIFLGIPLSMGLVNAHLAASRGEKPTWHHMGYAFGPRYWPTIGLGLLSILIVVGGLILLIIPGIYLAVKLSFTSPRFIEDDLGVMDAIRASFADVKGRWWNVFGLALMAIPLIIAGLLALFVGVFVAMVLISQMSVVYWRGVQAQGPAMPAMPE